jgi:hypothetical protein
MLLGLGAHTTMNSIALGEDVYQSRDRVHVPFDPIVKALGPRILEGHLFSPRLVSLI